MSPRMHPVPEVSAHGRAVTTAATGGVSSGGVAPMGKDDVGAHP